MSARLRSLVRFGAVARSVACAGAPKALWAALALAQPVCWAQAQAPALAASSTLPASRLAAQWEGPALVGQLQLRLIVLDAERGAVAAALTVGSPQCSGGLDSLGQWQRGTLVLKPYRPEPDAAACEVQVRVDPDGRRARVSETGCGAYRGAACVFEGQLQAR
ncbi:hypothetical protein [Acidovorax sp. 94]|uniref:hypothetical protein n=1 Tax=Acidovorax sp. 94 TaxID=2135633 RepID=UPI0011C3C381|nr:hypothetical protein [Acidovorax sp. 94]